MAMNCVQIPERFQVFGARVVLLDKDRERLSPHLEGWMGLAGILLLGVNEPDLKRLIVLELMGKARWKILDRLLMRLGREQRKALQTKVKECLSSKSASRK